MPAGSNSREALTHGGKQIIDPAKGDLMGGGGDRPGASFLPWGQMAPKDMWGEREANHLGED